MRNVKRNLILGYHRGGNKWKGLGRALESIGQEVTVVIDNFDNIEGTYDQVWTMAESLLPIQAELEERYNINNVSKRAAEILSDKKMMDDFCIENGLGALIPDSVIATSSNDLDLFEDKAFIVKPTIGSGCKKNYDTDIAYCSYLNKDDFFKDTHSDLVFRLNQVGWQDPLFNNRHNYYMFQEHLHHNRIYGPYYYVNELGHAKELFWITANLENSSISDYSFQSRPIDFWIVDEDEVPDEVLKASRFYFDIIVEELNVKNMFFAGPDFYYQEGLPLKVIDCNPRIGQGLQILNEVHGERYLPSILENNIIDLEIKFYWVNADLKPGKIKEIKDMSHLSEYMLSTNPGFLPGHVIQEFTYNNEDAPRIGLKIPGKDKAGMLKTYRLINDEIQKCITYED
jgi:hypothetical protein